MLVLILCFFKPSNTSIQPSMGSVHRVSSIVQVARIWSTLIKSHYYISSNGSLYIHNIFWRKQMTAAVYMRLEFHTFFCNLSIIGQRIYLKSSAIRQNIPIPINKLMQPTSIFYNIHLWTHLLVIDIDYGYT